MLTEKEVKEYYKFLVDERTTALLNKNNSPTIEGKDCWSDIEKHLVAQIIAVRKILEI